MIKQARVCMILARVLARGTKDKRKKPSSTREKWLYINVYDGAPSQT